MDIINKLNLLPGHSPQIFLKNIQNYYFNINSVDSDIFNVLYKEPEVVEEFSKRKEYKYEKIDFIPGSRNDNTVIISTELIVLTFLEYEGNIIYFVHDLKKFEQIYDSNKNNVGITNYELNKFFRGHILAETGKIVFKHEINHIDRNRNQFGFRKGKNDDSRGSIHFTSFMDLDGYKYNQENHVTLGDFFIYSVPYGDFYTYLQKMEYIILDPRKTITFEFPNMIYGVKVHELTTKIAKTTDYSNRIIFTFNEINEEFYNQKLKFKIEPLIEEELESDFSFTVLVK